MYHDAAAARRGRLRRASPRRRRSRSRCSSGARSPRSSRADPTGGANPMHTVMGELFAQGRARAARRAGVRVPPPGRGRRRARRRAARSSTSTRRRPTRRDDDVRRHGDGVDATRDAAHPVVTERFNLIARRKKPEPYEGAPMGRLDRTRSRSSPARARASASRTPSGSSPRAPRSWSPRSTRTAPRRR